MKTDCCLQDRLYVYRPDPRRAVRANEMRSSHRDFQRTPEVVRSVERRGGGGMTIHSSRSHGRGSHMYSRDRNSYRRR